MAAAKKQTKQDLENKIVQLEAKLNKLAEQFEAKPKPEPKPAEVKPAGPKPAEVKPAGPKPAEVKPAESKPAEVKPAESKPAEVKPAESKPKGTLPKDFDTKPADTPKTTDTKSQSSSTVQGAIENAYQNARMTDFHWYRANVTGYSPAPNRYFVRTTAPVGKVPTTNWNDQKAKVPGYTQPSNQYFATRARLAYHAADKKFGSFSGINLTVDGIVAQSQTYSAPPPKSSTDTLPKGTEPAPSSSGSNNSGKSRKDELDEYEKNYLKRIEQQKIDQEQKYYEESVSKSSPSKVRGTLPKGFESKPADIQKTADVKSSKGTLPKGF